jgi:Second Messenger Oligonucleotide or Dinucleotide Synthetase domain
MAITNRARSHRRLATFVDWIKPDPEMREAIRTQADNIRHAIGKKAAADGLVVVTTPESGSFAKHTGLRRHLRGNSEIEGQDVDLPFIVKPAKTDGERINELLQRFARYAAASYPNTPREITGSSVELRFVASKLNYDLVPMLSANYPNYQDLLKKNGERRITSVQMHTQFVRRRTRLSDELPGRVKFNECVRLMKWWRDVRVSNANSIHEVRTMLIDLLCASAYDKFSVEPTYTETLFNWFSWMASVTARRTNVSFDDYDTIEPLNKTSGTNQLWQVIDPVNVNNNVVHSEWANIELDELASWFGTGRDSFSRLIAQEQAGNDGNVDAILLDLFGGPIITHGTLL